jgi:hypothetical protein
MSNNPSCAARGKLLRKQDCCKFFKYDHKALAALVAICISNLSVLSNDDNTFQMRVRESLSE